MKKQLTAGLIVTLLLASGMAFAGTGGKRTDPGRTTLPARSSAR